MNLSSSSPINIKNGEKVSQDQLIQERSVDQLTNVKNYFYKFDHAGIGKNYIARYGLENKFNILPFFSYVIFRLTESETKTIMNIFADHTGVIIDPFGVNRLPNNQGIRISPRQSPVYQSMV